MLEHNPTARCLAGERYESQVPDTLDVAERMGLAVNALTNVWDPDERWALGFDVDFSPRPPVLVTNHVTDAYLNIPPKFLEALVLCRLASGTDLNIEVDQQVLATQLDLLGEDGLTYCPTDTLKEFKESRPYAEVWGEGRMLLALTMLAQVDDDPRWARIAERKVDRLLALTRRRDDFRFLWKGRFRPGEEPPSDADEHHGNVEGGSILDRYPNPKMGLIYSVGSTGHGSGLLYRTTGYEPALELSRGLARWALARVFPEKVGGLDPDFHHFHHTMYALMAVCEYGYAAEDRAVLERVDAWYRWAREMGDPLVGYYTEWFPGCDRYLGWQQGNSVETCEVSDMVFLALYLTRAGIGDYWDDVDRWVRNVYAEAQMLDTDFLDKIPDSYFSAGRSPRFYEDTRDIARRSVGSFWGWMRANDGLRVMRTEEGPKLPDKAIMHCCTANGARSLYHVWDSIVTRESDVVRVNLLLNRASPWVDVDSYLPVEGKAEIRIKDAEAIAVRVPEWSSHGQMKATVNGSDARTALDGQYVRVSGLKRGDVVAVAFPVPERKVHRVIGGLPYALTLRGANVVSIEPRGTAYPLYERQASGKAVPKKRFIPSIREIVW